MGSVFLPRSCYSILVVDDDQEILNLLKTPLVREGHEVFTAREGNQALSILEEQRIDLILSDVDMPEMNGYELVRLVKENAKTAEIPFLFFSALDELDDRLKGLELGANDYITKPFSPKEVCLRVRNVLEQKSLHEKRHTSTLKAALDLIQLGVVLIDEKGAVKLYNQTAQEIFSQKDGLVMRHDKLNGQDPTETKRIEKMLLEARSMVNDKDPAIVSPIRLPRPSMLRDFALIALPLDVDDGNFRVVSIIIHDPETTNTPSPEILSDAYHFTKAEARVASLLIQGKAISEIGEELDVSRNTVCSHLKKLYMKTDTQRQNDFTRLLLSGLSQLKLS